MTGGTFLHPMSGWLVIFAIGLVAYGVWRYGKRTGVRAEARAAAAEPPPAVTVETVRPVVVTPPPATTTSIVRTIEVRRKRTFMGFLLVVLMILFVISAGMWIVQQPVFGSLNPWGWVWNRPQDSTVRDYGWQHRERRAPGVVVTPLVSAEERARVEAQTFPPVFAPPGEWSEWIRIPDGFTTRATPGPGSNLYRTQCSSSYDMPGAGDPPVQEVPCLAASGRGAARWIRFRGTDPYGVDITYRFVLT